MTNPKTCCTVPGCKRWSRHYPEGWWFLCPRHYAMAPARVKRRRNAIRRRLVKLGEAGHANGIWSGWTDRAWRIDIAIGKTLLNAAVRAAAGI